MLWMLSYLLWDVSVLIHWQAWPPPNIKLVNFKSSSIYHHLSALHKCISYLDRCWPIDFLCFSCALQTIISPPSKLNRPRHWHWDWDWRGREMCWPLEREEWLRGLLMCLLLAWPALSHRESHSTDFSHK